MRLFPIRAFAVENVVLFTSMIVFIPIFFFASIYAQVALGDGPQEAGLYLLVFFAGFAPGVQVGGRRLDKQGAKGVVMAGCAIAAVGLALWASRVTQLSLGQQWYFIVIAGFGMGLMVGPANTDAINQVGRLSYGEATGITQTVAELRGQLRPGRARHPAGHRRAQPPGHPASRASACRRPTAHSAATKLSSTRGGERRRPRCRPRWPGRSSTPLSSAWPRACAPCCTRWPG